MKKIVIIPVALFLFFFTIFSTLSLAEDPSWYYSNLMKRKNITVINTQNSNTLADYQVPFYISYDSDMQSDFDDLRFTWYNKTSSLEQEINYYLEGKSDSSWAKVWVKVPKITGSDTETVFIYYGNSTLTSASDGQSVYYIFDDFSGSFNTTKWSIISGTASNSNGILSLSGTVSDIRTNSILTDFVVEYNFSTSSTNGGLLGSVIYLSDANRWIVRHYDYYYATVYMNLMRYKDGSATTPISVGFARNSNWHNDTVARNQSGAWTLWYDGTKLDTIVDTWLPSGADKFQLWRDAVGGMSFDYVKMRKYSTPEPTYSIGSEETTTYISVTFHYVGIGFGSLQHNTTNNPFPSNQIGILNATVDTNTNYKVSAHGTDFSGGGYTFPITNLRMDTNSTASDLSLGQSKILQLTDVLIDDNIPYSYTTNYHGYWLSIPYGQYATDYSSTVTITYANV